MLKELENPQIDTYTKPLNPSSPFSVVKDVVNSGREMIKQYTNPIPTTTQLEKERGQSLIPEEAQKIKRKLVLEQGMIPVGEDKYLDMTGFVGSLENVGKRVGKKALTKGFEYLDEFLGDWVTSNKVRGSMDSNLIKNIEQQAKDWIPEKPVKLYRGTQTGEKVLDRPSSWTYNREAAQMFAEENGGRVISKKVDPSEILIDTTMLPHDLALKYGMLADEEEVILKPITEKLFHGTNDLSWVKKGELIKKSESSTLGNPGVFFTKNAQEAADWVPASGGFHQTKEQGLVGGVIELSKKKTQQFNLKKMSEGEYESVWLDTMKELRKNPEKFGVDKYGVHELKGWEIVEQKLIKEGYDGVDFGKSGVLFDPKQVEVKIHGELEKNKGFGYTLKSI